MGPLVDERTLARLLDDVAAGTTPVADAVEALRTLPYESVTDARVDHHRELRTGHPEAIYGPGKSLEQIRDIASSLAAHSSGAVLLTRATPEQAAAAIEAVPGARYHERARLVVVKSEDGLTVSQEALARAIDGDTALVALSHTAYRSAFVYDMAAVTALAHRAGALTLWDLSHSVGAVPVELATACADVAVGCTYKYVNGGPGAPSFLYVRGDLHESLTSPIWGWFGRRDQFDMASDYSPAPGILRFLVGTPPILSLLAVEPGVDLLLEAGMDRVRAKSVAQTEYLIRLWERELQPLGFALNSPRDAAIRGSHISLGHAEALRIDRALIDEMGVLPDFRYPDNLRLGIAPLYTSFADLHEAVARIVRVLRERRHERYPSDRLTIT